MRSKQRTKVRSRERKRAGKGYPQAPAEWEKNKQEVGKDVSAC